jgi:NADPH-dependent F420 reductase
MSDTPTTPATAPSTTTPAPAADRDPRELPSFQGTVAVLGGTGEQGRGLATRFASVGVPVVVGSRDAVRAAGIAAEIGFNTRGAANADAAAAADVVIVAVPWDGHEALLTELAEVLSGKIVVDCVNPLGFDKQGAFALPVPDGSAAQQAQRVAPNARVVGAFHHVSAALLLDLSVESIDTDVMVVGDDRAATDLVQSLAALLPGARGIFAGRLRNAGQVEALTANLISANRRYKAHTGVRITDV